MVHDEQSLGFFIFFSLKHMVVGQHQAILADEHTTGDISVKIFAATAIVKRPDHDRSFTNAIVKDLGTHGGNIRQVDCKSIGG